MLPFHPEKVDCIPMSSDAAFLGHGLHSKIFHGFILSKVHKNEMHPPSIIAGSVIAYVFHGDSS